MKILFGIQGTGHGHISRAREIIPQLMQYGEIDILISGYACQLELDGFLVNKKRGLSLIYNKKGQVSILKTAGSMRFGQFIYDINALSLANYDMIISDFEPVTSWAARKVGRKVIGLSHQASFISEKTPRPEEVSNIAEKIMTYYAPSTIPIGFHFKRYDTFIEPPVIRKDIRNLSPLSQDHITVYLPAYDDQYMIGLFKEIPEIRWDIFSPRADHVTEIKNVRINKVDNDSFLKSLESSYGVLTGGGFETCAESLFLGKKLMVIPISNQYEQLCNAAALRQIGIPVLNKLEHSSKDIILKWLKINNEIALSEYCNVPGLVKKIIDKGSIQQ